MSLQLEGSCRICGDAKSYFRNSFENCGNVTHKFHKGCLKSVIKDFLLLFFIEDCENCLIKFIQMCKDSIKCIKCQKALDKKIAKSNCKWKQSFCEECLWKPYAYAISHRNSCLNCSLIYCITCGESVNILLNSREQRCLNHSLCISCLKNNENTSCQLCSLYVRNAIYECSLCGDALSISEVCCKSGHFYCKFCLQHFIWTPNNCESCKNLFKLENKSIITVEYYKSPYQSFRTVQKRLLPTNTCYQCNIKGEYPICQSFKCKKCYYCLKCLNGETLVYSNCEDCKDFFKKHSQIIPKKVIICNLCWNVPDGTSSFCEDFHYYCIKCRDYLIQVEKIMLLKVLSCKKCVKEIRALREYAELYQIPSEKVLIVIPKYKFICGHEIRHDSLSKILLLATVKFLENLRNLNIDELNKGFSLTCQFCNQRIFAPLHKFERSLQPEFDPNEWNLIQGFSCIFDGLSYTFKQSNQKIRCYIGGIKIFSRNLS